MMKVRMADNCPHKFWVTSEEEPDKEYCVDICEHELGLDEDGVMEFNGSCFLTKTPDEYEYRGCKDFLFRCLPRLRKEENMGKVFRCKHIRAAESYALKLLKPYLKKHNPNNEDEVPR